MKKAILVNPYIVGNPIKSREMFFGREDDFAYVTRKIGENRPNQILVLCGERRSGKTSILFQILGGRLGRSFLPVLIDMQLLAGIKGDPDFFHAILKAGCAMLGSEGPTLEELERAAAGQGVERLFEAFLTLVQERSPDRIVLFLLDEYELIEAKIRDGSLSESTIHYLAGILESPYRVSFIFTGSTNLEDRKVEVWKSLLGKSIYRKISYLSRGDTARLITEPVRESLTYPADMVDAICRLTGGQPFYTQVICQNLVDLLIETAGDPQFTDLERVVRDIVDNPLPQMIYSWNSLAEWEQVVLASLASGLADPGAWAGSQAVHRFLLRSRIVLPFKRERINVLLEQAYHGEMLEKDDQGSYRFRMDLFRRWISREHSIWKVAREASLEFHGGRRILALAAAIILPLAALAAFGWFVLVPRFMPQLVLRSTPPPAAQAAELKNITFTSNRGPFRLNIDNSTSLNFTSEGQPDPRSIRVVSLTPGTHVIVATSREGSPVTRTIQVTRNGERFEIAFEAVKQKPPGRAEGELSTTGGKLPAEGARAPPASAEAIAAADATGAPATAAAPAEELKEGDLVVASKPSEAAVTLDGRITGKVTPYVEKLPPGEHLIVLSLEGYRPAEVRLTVEPGNSTRQEIALEEAWAELTFDVRPTAKIYLDEEYKLDTPYTKPLKVRAGRHVVTIRNEALTVDEQIPVTLQEGEKLPIMRVLK